MPSQRNIHQLAVLKEKLGNAASGVFVDHSGLKVSEQQDLREKLKAVDGDFLVTKNTLLSLALQEEVPQVTRVPQVTQVQISATSETRGTRGTRDTFLRGPTSLVLSYRDEILPIKVLAEFSKTHEKPTIKAGFLGEQALTKEDILTLAQLPGKQELLGKLLATMQGPMRGMVRVLNGNMRELMTVLANIKDQRSNIKDA